METVLTEYVRPYDPTRPSVNMDETSKQLVAETTKWRRLTSAIAAILGPEGA